MSSIKKSVLLLDASFCALPLYEYLVSQKYDVWVMGNRPHDPLAQIAGEKWLNQDYSKVSEVRKYIEKYAINFVVPGCTDVSIETAIALGINNDLFDSPQTYRQLAQKEAFRALCKELDLPSPQVVPLERFPQKGKYICKPVDAFSGRGVCVLNGENTDELQKAYLDACKESTSSDAIIETFVNGQLYSFSAFVENEAVVEFFIVKEGSSVNQYAVDTSYVEADFNAEAIEVLRNSIESISSHLKLKDGLIHLQFILDEETQTPYFIELSRRCPGDLYSMLIEYTTGYRYAAQYVSYFLRQNARSKRGGSKHILRHTIASQYATHFTSFTPVEPLSVFAFYPLLMLGEKVQDSQKTRVGIVFGAYDSHSELLSGYESFLSKRAYTIDTLQKQNNKDHI